jgi:cytochrome P450 family 9
MNHQMQLDENVDRLFSRSLFIMRDQRWRDMRATLSPAFTGSKMRLMFQLVMEVANDNMAYLKSQMTNNFVDVELGDLMPRYANDVIAKCAFGISINSMKNRDNEFFKMGSKFIQLSKSLQFKFFLYSAFPKLSKFLRIPMMDAATCNFF